MESYVDAKTVADFLGISRRQVLDWTRAMKLPGYKLGDTWRYKLSEVDAAIGSTKVVVEKTGVLPYNKARKAGDPVARKAAA